MVDAYDYRAGGLTTDVATTTFGQDVGVIMSAYVMSSIPLLILFIYATKPFIQGVTSGAFKA